MVGTCWAHSIGGCSSKMSREHVVSKALFVGGQVDVRGLPWCKNETKRIGLANLTTKVLCKSHNERLSDVDSAGAQAFDVFRRMTETSNARKKMKRGSWQVKRYEVNGPLLERWFLKTLINFCVEGSVPMGRENLAVGVVPPRLVQVAYGLTPFAGRSGLYSIVRSGMQINSTDTLEFAPLIKDGHHVEGGLFSFRGFSFLLFLEADGPPAALSGLFIGDVHLGGCQLNLRNSRVDEHERGYKSQVLDIVW